MKKVFLIIITLVLSTLLFACDEGEQPVEEFVLPALQGKTKSEVLSTLSGAPITFTFDEVVAFNIPEDTFVQYGDNLKPGSKVAHGTSIVIYFSVHKNILPDLTGKSQSQVLTTLNNNYKLGTIDVRRVDSDEVEPGYFVGYGNGYVPGYEVPIDSEIIVYIAQEPAANKSAKAPKTSVSCFRKMPKSQRAEQNRVKQVDPISHHLAAGTDPKRLFLSNSTSNSFTTAW